MVGGSHCRHKVVHKLQRRGLGKCELHHAPNTDNDEYGDLGETGENGEIGEMVKMVKTVILVKW